MSNFKVLLAAAAFALARSAAAEPALVFQKSGKEIARLTAKELSAKVPPRLVKLFDPQYGKEKSYRCFPIKPLMDAAFGAGWDRSSFADAALQAADGYVSQASADKLAEDGGCLAFEDADVLGWELVGRKKVNPGPFYLVWTKPGQDAENAYPWPWRLASINLIRFEERYPEVVPAGASAGSPAYRGYAVFRSLCMRCHSINRQGGKIGPDLNAPQSVVRYRTKRWIKSYVRAPSKYRYTEMPDHPQLTDGDLEDLYAYFALKSRQPEKSWGDK